MYARTVNRPKQRRAELKSFAAPVSGWISNRNLASPAATAQEQGAAILDNFFPTATSAILRRGKSLYATLGDGDKNCTALFTYVIGGNQKLFGATATTIYDLTNVVYAENTELTDGMGNVLTDGMGNILGFQSTTGKDVLTGAAGGEWITAQFTVTGGTYLFGVNGASAGFIYDGTAFATPTVTFGTSGLTTANMSYVFVYKNRLYFVQKDTFTIWYLEVDSISGTAKSFNVGSEFNRGGQIMFGEKWSLDTGERGGLSEQIIFVSTEGEIVVYQGLSPDDTQTWSKVGLYRTGVPLGKKAWVRAGGDIIIATSIGFLPVSQAIQRDYAALSPAAVSYPIEDAWNDATRRRGMTGWNCELWPEGQMVLVSPPVASGMNEPVLFVSNARTGSWARFTNWNAKCMAVFRGRLFFGSEEGKVYIGNVTGYDDGEPYTGVYLPLFEDFGTPASRKIAGNARATTRAKSRVNDKLEAKFDFSIEMSAAPSATPVPIAGTWGTGTWGVSTWGEEQQTYVDQNWRSIGGMGYSCALGLMVTSGAINPLDVEIIRLDMTFTTAEMVT